VVLEVPLPFWAEAEDVRVDVGERRLRVAARGGLGIERTYWRNRWAAPLLTPVPLLAWPRCLDRLPVHVDPLGLQVEGLAASVCS
jgi:hypothetical protein